jgi:dihydroflavonol-4-reductase
MKVFITGICGFLGRHIALNLAAKGFEVKGLYHKTKPPESFKKYKIGLVKGDIHNINEFKSEFYNFDFIIHTAASVSNSKKTSKINVHGTRLILKFAREMNVKNFIHTSSRAVFGVSKPPEISNEQSTLSIESKIKDIYLASKINSEKEVLEARDHGDINCFIISPTAIIGPGDSKPTPIGQLINNFLLGKISFFIEGKINVIDVRDLAELYYLCIKYGNKNENYGAGGFNINLSKLFKMLQQQSNLEKFPRRIPNFLIKLLVAFLNLFPYISKINPMYDSNRIKRLVNGHSLFDSSKIKKEFKFTPTSIEKTVKDIVDERK